MIKSAAVLPGIRLICIGKFPISKKCSMRKKEGTGKNRPPIGIPGELCISGSGMARGYLNCVELTCEKFITTFLKNEEKIYKTGDLARYTPDGNIEFLGRTDHQVNIRGFRVEPGEIESRLQAYEEINEAVVITRDGERGNKNIWLTWWRTNR